MAALEKNGQEMRALELNGLRTTIALDGPFWREAEALAGKKGISWQEWVRGILANIPEGWSRSRWLRLAILERV